MHDAMRHREKRREMLYLHEAATLVKTDYIV